MPGRIEDYAFIGDCQTGALVGRDGSIDWLCVPRFDSGACFAALLGEPGHGRWKLAPADPVRRVRRWYRPGTLVLETEYTTDSGRFSVVDFMPHRTATPDLVRLVQGHEGRAAVDLELIMRFDYGSIVPWVRRTEEGLTAIAGPDRVRLTCPVQLVGANFATISRFTVAAGQCVPFVFSWHPSHEPEPPRLDARAALEATERWWREWADRCTYQGAHRDLVVRSLITLKALIYAPTGGIVAAPTTSLPEHIGGVRNWDYRYCWLRDATFTLMALMLSGYTAEAIAWRDWLTRAAAGKPENAHIMYGLAGERRLDERVLEWLPGYEGSAPVRIGNAASTQFQLDVYGEVLDALFQCRRLKPGVDEDEWRIARALVRFVEDHWEDPDEGIWEVRGQRRHFTHSKVMAWAAIDRAIRSVEAFGFEGPVDRWRMLRDMIHTQVCRYGYDASRRTFVQHYGGSDLDASLLVIPSVGFLPADDPRMVGTVEAIRRELVRDGFVVRYLTETPVDGLPPGEGAFLPCSFWLVDNLVMQGRLDEGRELFERLVATASDLGLLAEEYDPVSRRLLGNYPQAFTHVGLVNTAWNLTGIRSPVEQRRR